MFYEIMQSLCNKEQEIKQDEAVVTLHSCNIGIKTIKLCPYKLCKIKLEFD